MSLVDDEPGLSCPRLAEVAAVRSPGAGRDVGSRPRIHRGRARRPPAAADWKSSRPSAVFSYDAKYASSLDRISLRFRLARPNCATRSRASAVAAAQALGTAGLARVDVMLDGQDGVRGCSKSIRCRA